MKIDHEYVNCTSHLDNVVHLLILNTCWHCKRSRALLYLLFNSNKTSSQKSSLAPSLCTGSDCLFTEVLAALGPGLKLATSSYVLQASLGCIPAGAAVFYARCAGVCIGLRQQREPVDPQPASET